MMYRRDVLRLGGALAGSALLGSSLWRGALGSPAHAAYEACEPVESWPYGPLLEPDENGIMLPAGVRSRIVTRSNETVADTSYTWHIFPDGGATYPTRAGGWIYASNSEAVGPVGVSAIRFAPDASVLAAYPILMGTIVNCAGGATPWGTWLSCEEYDSGHVGGDLVVAEDGGNMELVIISPTGTAAALLRVIGQDTSELTGPAFSPHGDRLYFSSPRGNGLGITYEVTGPFRRHGGPACG